APPDTSVPTPNPPGSTPSCSPLQQRSKVTSAKRIVFGTEVTFRDSKNHQTFYDNLLRHTAHPGEEPPSFDYTEMGMVATSVNQTREKGTLMMVASGPNPVWEQTQQHKFLGDIPAAKKKQAEVLTEWHTFGVYYRGVTRKTERAVTGAVYLTVSILVWPLTARSVFRVTPRYDPNHY
ncbi:MAG: hypothetical protein M1823_006205, partial [Watsoniomyces obsoletus]